jgi:hypothetical protein
MCLPVTDDINAIFAGADQQALGTLLAKMGACVRYLSRAVQCNAVRYSTVSAAFVVHVGIVRVFLWMSPVALVLLWYC